MTTFTLLLNGIEIELDDVFTYQAVIRVVGIPIIIVHVHCTTNTPPAIMAMRI